MKNVIQLSILMIMFSLALNAQGKTAIICGKLITAEDNRVYTNMVVVIDAERIVEIGPSDIIKSDYKIIDLTGYTVLPGLIDAHVHPLIYGDDYQVNHLKGSSAFNALRGLKVVQNWLNEGWTSIRIAGDADTQYAHFEIRDAINAGLFDGPRIFGAGHYLSVTGGAGTRTPPKNFNYGPLGGFSTFDFGAEYRWSNNVSFNFNISNMFNTKQIEFVGSPSIGRLAMASIKVTD